MFIKCRVSRELILPSDEVVSSKHYQRQLSAAIYGTPIRNYSHQPRPSTRKFLVGRRLKLNSNQVHSTQFVQCFLNAPVRSRQRCTQLNKLFDELIQSDVMLP